jgi:hypothetical protein
MKFKCRLCWLTQAIVERRTEYLDVEDRTESILSSHNWILTLGGRSKEGRKFPNMMFDFIVADQLSYLVGRLTLSTMPKYS